MRGRKLSIGLRAMVGILIVSMFATAASARTFKTLHDFDSNKDGFGPANVTFHDGNLYGVLGLGGAGGYGSVYELSPTAAGGWEEKILQTFNGRRGLYPNKDLIFDSAGNLYGTTQLSTGGEGEVFELSPTAKGFWKEKILVSLDGSDGSIPESGVVFDASGNIYSTAYEGGASGNGTVFELMPVAGGSWKEATLFSFDGTNGSGFTDNAVLDALGNLYGTGYAGGAYGAGTVIELTPHSDGSWTETTLYNFTGGDDGANPRENGGLVLDSAGNLYGTTQNGGRFGDGTVFELSPKIGGGWTETVLHNFNGLDGSHPQAHVIFDASGNLYGDTYDGGEDNDGVVFELSPEAGGSWRETVLHSFFGKDGAEPWQGLVFDASGNLYGVAQVGGLNGDGTVFEITP
jgi:uncharacterized repeat protein (TIGR03803 family)